MNGFLRLLGLLVALICGSIDCRAGAPPDHALPVTHRAAMLVATAADAQKPAVTIGTVVWSAAPALPGQPGSGGVKADIDIPDLKMHASMILRKNTDAALPASHTIDLRLIFDEGSSIKGVKDIDMPRMRRDEFPNADSLLGVKVKINDSYFLIGLNLADADVARNVDEIATRGWFDFPLLLNDDRIGKLTFEKAGDGERIVADALAAWKGAIQVNADLNPPQPSPSRRRRRRSCGRCKGMREL